MPTVCEGVEPLTRESITARLHCAADGMPVCNLWSYLKGMQVAEGVSALRKS